MNFNELRDTAKVLTGVDWASGSDKPDGYAWFNTPHPVNSTDAKMLDTPSGELLPSGVETAHGVPIDKLRKASE